METFYLSFLGANSGGCLGLNPHRFVIDDHLLHCHEDAFLRLLLHCVGCQFERLPFLLYLLGQVSPEVQIF
jgi:hypothetical protein